MSAYGHIHRDFLKDIADLLSKMVQKENLFKPYFIFHILCKRLNCMKK